MNNELSLHPIHPTLQFEAKHALRYLDNLLRKRTTSIDSGSNVSRSTLFGAVPVFASGNDLKADFESLSGSIGPYEFRWNGNSLNCTTESLRHAVRLGSFEVDFGDEPCNFLEELWSCPQPEVRACVRAAVSRLAKALARIEPSKYGGVASRFAVLCRRYRLSARERDLLFVGLCVEHGLLQYNLDGFYQFNYRILIRLEEAASYLESDVNDLLPLIRNDAKLFACGLMDDDLTPSRETLEFLEGRASLSGVTARRLLADGASDDDAGFDETDIFVE